MFNFKELQLNKRSGSKNNDPFVGIRKNECQELEFYLPIGFDSFPEGDFNATKNIFFRMYRTFKKFEKEHKDKIEDLLDSQSKRKDNIETSDHAYQFKDKEGNEVLLYSKINIIENMLETYRDLALNIIERKIQRNENIDFSKIDRYLHKAIYLENDMIYIDEMDLAQQTLQYENASLIDLFCFILSELQYELEQTIEKRVSEISNKFKEQYLTQDQSLFNEETFETTIILLKEILDEIDKKTVYKDDDYWQLYEAIEAFLYGELDMENTYEKGIFWGINNFYQIWEDMCNTYAFKNFKDIVYADTNITINDKQVSNRNFGGCKVFCKDGFENPFFIEFQGKKRWMRPDLIRGSILLFEDCIKIDGEISDSSRFNFKVKYLEGEECKKIGEAFCNYLKKKMKKNHGTTFRDGTFRNYTKKQLESNKSDFLENIKITLIDWKYQNYNLIISNSKKNKKDIIKQLSYEFALLQDNYKDYNVESQFVIPYYYQESYIFKDNNDIGDFVEDKKLNEDLKKNAIKVFQANFEKIQKIYLSEL